MACVAAGTRTPAAKSHHHSRSLSGVFSSLFEAVKPRCYASQELFRSSSKNKRALSCVSVAQPSSSDSLVEESELKKVAKRSGRMNLKQIIQQEEEQQPKIAKQQQQQQLKLAHNQDLKAIILQLQSSSLELKENAAAQIRKLSRDSAENREVLANLGAIPLLVQMLDYSQSTTFQASALLALLNLAIGNNENKAALVAHGAVPKIVNILNSETISAAQESSAAVFLSLSALDSNKAVIGHSGAVLPLVRILKEGPLQARKDSIRVLYNLSLCSANSNNLNTANIIPVLLDIVTVDEFADKALAILGNLVAASDQSRKSVVTTKQGMQKLLAALTLYMDSSASYLDTNSRSSNSSSSSSSSSSTSRNSNQSPAEEDYATRCLERVLYVLMVLSHHSAAARQAMIRVGAVSPLLEVALLGSAVAQKRASRIYDCLRQDKMQDRPVSAPLGRGSCDEEQDGNAFDQRRAVDLMVKQSLERNMEKMVRRAGMQPSRSRKPSLLGTSFCSRSLRPDARNVLAVA